MALQNSQTTNINKTSVPKLNIDWEHFRSDIDISEVAGHLGIEMIGKGGSFLCPSHNDTNNPSARIRPKSNSWHCFTCGAGGTCLDLVQAVNGGTILEAAQYLETIYPGGIEVVGDVTEEEQEVKIPDNLLKQIGLKRNPFAVQTVRVPVASADNTNEKNPVVFEQKRYYIDPLQAAELVLDHCMEYRNKHAKMVKQIEKLYPGLNQEAVTYMHEKNKSDLAPIISLANEMRDIIAANAKEYVPWDEDKKEINNTADEPDR